MEFHCLALVPYYFNPRSSCEERHDVDAISADIVQFHSTLLMRGATEVVLLDVLIPLFYSSLVIQRAIDSSPTGRSSALFQSTLLMRGATWAIFLSHASILFQSTLLMRGATRRLMPSTAAICHFNPRSSCEERPNGRFSRAMRVYYFNPRSSCEERRPVPSASRHSMRFQSTLLMRGATRRPIRVHKLERNFNPRSSCEERLAMVASSSQAAEISIHAPHARSDGVGW